MLHLCSHCAVAIVPSAQVSPYPSNKARTAQIRMQCVPQAALNGHFSLSGALETPQGRTTL